MHQGWVEILMITLVSSQKSLPPNISASSVVTVKSMVEISQNFVAFSEYMNFNIYKQASKEVLIFQKWYLQEL